MVEAGVGADLLEPGLMEPLLWKLAGKTLHLHCRPD